jgi:hypothetical protein
LGRAMTIATDVDRSARVVDVQSHVKQIHGNG